MIDMQNGNGLLETVGNDDDARARLLATGNIVLLARVEAIREHFGEGLSEYVVRALKRFANLASPDDWRLMVTKLESAADPGIAWLDCALKWAIARDMRDVQAFAESAEEPVANAP